MINSTNHGWSLTICWTEPKWVWLAYPFVFLAMDIGLLLKKIWKDKKKTIEQRINWGTHTKIMDPLMLFKTTTIRDENTTPILVREATKCSQHSLKLMIIERDSFDCEWGRTLKKIE